MRVVCPLLPTGMPPLTYSDMWAHAFPATRLDFTLP
jgi:hypothetical protein